MERQRFLRGIPRLGSIQVSGFKFQVCFSALNFRFAQWLILCKLMYMNGANPITVSVATGRATFSDLIAKAKAGVDVIITHHGQPQVVLTAYRPAGKPWRVAVPTDPARLGDLQSPVLEDWQ